MSSNPDFLPVRLNNTSYLIDTTQYQRTTIPVSRQQRDNSKEPGENTLDTTGAWVRSQTDWSQGAGQLYLDNDDSDRRRFYRSEGIDVWTKGQLTLLNQATNVVTGTTFTSDEIIVERFGTSVFVANGTNVSSTGNPTGSSPVWAAVTTTAAVKDMTSDGSFVYYAQGSVLQRLAIGSSGAATNFGSLTPDIIQMAAGRLVAADANNIYELDSTGAKVSGSLDYTLPFSTSTWVSVTAGVNGIYAAGNTDSTGTIYFVGVNDTSGLLKTPVISGSLPRNESINKILSYNNLLLIATSKGLRLGLIDTSSSGVTIGPVIDASNVNQPLGGAAHSLETDGQFIWWGSAYGNTYRANLSTFTSALVPAYAADVRALSTAATSLVKSIVRIDDKVFLGVKTSGVSVLNREAFDETKVPTGFLIAGEVTWSTVVSKLLRSGVIDLDRTQYENTTIEYRQSSTDYNQNLYTYQYGAPSSVSVGSISLTAKNNNNHSAVLPNMLTGIPQVFTFAAGDNTSINFDITIDLTRGVSPITSAPILHDWACTAVAVPDRIDEIIVPIILKHSVTTGRNTGASKHFDSNAQFTELRNLMETGTSIEYQEGDRLETVTIERLQMTATRLSDSGSWWEGTLIARLLTVPS